MNPTVLKNYPSSKLDDLIGQYGDESNRDRRARVLSLGLPEGWILILNPKTRETLYVGRHSLGVMEPNPPPIVFNSPLTAFQIPPGRQKLVMKAHKAKSKPVSQ